MDKRIQGFETELYICSVVRKKAGVERARNFFGITHVGDLTAVRDVGFGAKKGGELGGGNDAGVMNSHDLPKFTTVRRIRRYAKVACCLSICPLNVTAGRCPARSAALLWHSGIGCV